MSDYIVSPGTHPCEWLLEGSWHAGTLALEPNKRARGEIFLPGQYDHEGLEYSRKWQYRRLAHLACRLRTETGVAIIDVIIRYGSSDKLFVSGSFAVCGPPVDTAQPEFEALEFQVTGLAAFSGVRPLEHSKTPSDLREITVTWNPETDQEIQYKNDTISLFFQRVAQTHDPFMFRFTTRPFVRVIGARRTLAKWLEQYVYPIREIISMAKSERQSCSWLTIGEQVSREDSEGNPLSYLNLAQVYGAEITQNITEPSGADLSGTLLFNTGPDGASLDTLLARWERLRDRYRTFMDLLSAGLNEELSARAAFLTAVPALESHHSVRADDSADTAEVEHARRSEIRTKLKDLLNPEDYKWTKNRLVTRESAALENRLRDTFEFLDSDLRRELVTRISPVPSTLTSVLPTAKDMWELIARLRNDLAHGGTSHPDTIVAPATRLVRTVAIGVLLAELQMPATRLIQDIRIGAWRSI